MKYIDKEEQEFIKSFENGEWRSIKKKNQKAFIKAAKESIASNKRVQIHLTPKDYHAIQAKALEEGIPYQALIASIVHNYNKGRLKKAS